jgi:tRNA-dihydrouridine synthase
VVAKLRGSAISGVLVGRGALRNPWIFSQAAALAGETQEVQAVSPEDKGRFLLEYIDLLLTERLGEQDGFRHSAVRGVAEDDTGRPARGRERWVINKVRALGSWYTKGLDGGSLLRTRINSAESVTALTAIISDYFG